MNESLEMLSNISVHGRFAHFVDCDVFYLPFRRLIF